MINNTTMFIRPYETENYETTIIRLNNIQRHLSGVHDALPPDDMGILKELFGPEFLTERYHLRHTDIVEL